MTLDPVEAFLPLYHDFWLRSIVLCGRRILSYKVLRRRVASESDRIQLTEGESGTAGIIRLKLQENPYHGWVKLGFDSSCRPVCFLNFPGSYNESLAIPGRLSSVDVAGMEEGPPSMVNHPIFDNRWIRASTDRPLPSYAYDSRRSANGVDGDFNFTFQAPLFKIRVSASRIPEPRSPLTDAVWAVDIAVVARPGLVGADQVDNTIRMAFDEAITDQTFRPRSRRSLCVVCQKRSSWNCIIPGEKLEDSRNGNGGRQSGVLIPPVIRRGLIC